MFPVKFTPAMTGLLILAMTVSQTPARGDDEMASIKRGLELAQLLCMKCHAISGPGPGPEEKSPPFSTIDQNLLLKAWQTSCSKACQWAMNRCRNGSFQNSRPKTCCSISSSSALRDPRKPGTWRAAHGPTLQSGPAVAVSPLHRPPPGRWHCRLLCRGQG